VGKHASTSKQTIIFMSSISCTPPKNVVSASILQKHAMVTHVCDGPMMARARTSRLSARRCGLEGKSKAPPDRWLTSAALPTGQHDRPVPNKFHVDPEIAYFPALRRVKPAQELMQAVSVRDDVHRRPVDRRLLVVVIYRVCGGKEGKQGVLGHSCPVLV
jgi:hypothetical protein